MTVAADARAAFIDALEMRDVRYTEVDDETLRVGWSAAPVDFRQYVNIEELHDGVVRIAVHLVPALAVPPSKRDATVLFMNRVNWDIALGNWELDESDGQVMLRLSFITDRVISAAVADYYLGISQTHCGRMMPYLMRIVNDGFSAEEAYLDYEADLTIDAGDDDEQGE